MSRERYNAVGTFFYLPRVEKIFSSERKKWSSQKGISVRCRGVDFRVCLGDIDVKREVVYHTDNLSFYILKK